MTFSKKEYFAFVSALISLIIFSYFFIDKPVAEYFLANIPTYEGVGDFISIFGESHWYLGSAVIGYLFFKYYKINKLYSKDFFSYSTSIYFQE